MPSTSAPIRSPVSSVESVSDLAYSSDPHEWLFQSVKGGQANHFDDVYGKDYYIGTKPAPKKKGIVVRIIRKLEKVLH